MNKMMIIVFLSCMQYGMLPAAAVRPVLRAATRPARGLLLSVITPRSHACICRHQGRACRASAMAEQLGQELAKLNTSGVDAHSLAGSTISDFLAGRCAQQIEQEAQGS